MNLTRGWAEKVGGKLATRAPEKRPTRSCSPRLDFKLTKMLPVTDRAPTKIVKCLSRLSLDGLGLADLPRP